MGVVETPLEGITQTNLVLQVAEAMERKILQPMVREHLTLIEDILPQGEMEVEQQEQQHTLLSCEETQISPTPI